MAASPYTKVAASPYTTRTYEPNTLRLSTLRTSRSGVSLQNLEYTYDGVGNVTIITDKREGSNTQTFNYDALNRLTSATGSYGTDAYSYSALGNILTKGPL